MARGNGLRERVSGLVSSRVWALVGLPSWSVLYYEVNTTPAWQQVNASELSNSFNHVFGPISIAVSHRGSI